MDIATIDIAAIELFLSEHWEAFLKHYKDQGQTEAQAEILLSELQTAAYE